MIDDTQDTQEAVVEEATESTEEVVSNDVASLSIQDLANLRNIIDVASQRGAFRTNEFTVVGATYTRLNNFIASVVPAPAVTEETTDEVAEEEATTEE